MICTIFRPKRTKNGKVAVSRLYRGRYRLDGDASVQDIPLNTTDKRVAQQKLEEIVKQKQLEAAGMLPSPLLRKTASTSLKSLLAEYLSDLRTMGRDGKYIYIVQKQIEKLAMECRWQLVNEVNPSSFLKWRSTQRKAPKTLNEYLDSMNSFLNWLERNHRIDSNQLKSIEKVQTKGRQVRNRRAFSAEEMKRLLAVAGPRKVVYLAAVFTGLRRAELEALEWEDVKLDEAKPFLIARASTTKNNKQAVMMLHPDLVAELRAIRPKHIPSGSRVFADRMPRMIRFKADLAAAKIEFLNAKGQRADFHSLRHTLATNLARSGAAPRVAMEVMRHSDMRLTANVYTDAGLLPISEAIAMLPSFTTPPAADSQIDSQNLFRRGPDLSARVHKSEKNGLLEVPENQGDRPAHPQRMGTW